MTGADLWAARLASGDAIAEPLAIVVAHPDDETLWAGSALARLSNLRLVHLTNGAPADMRDATRLGFMTAQAYASARARELDAALTALGAAPRRLGYGIRDQEVIEAADTIAERLARDLAGVACVVTHPYEGGHPDHDAAALACRRAADAIGKRTGAAPALVEFACYHVHDGTRRFGRFWPDPACPEHVREITATERARVDAAVRAHATQEFVIGDWRPAVERWRAAPRHDFAAPPPPGESLYDGFGWTITSGQWRALATAA